METYKIAILLFVFGMYSFLLGYLIAKRRYLQCQKQQEETAQEVTLETFREWASDDPPFVQEEYVYEDDEFTIKLWNTSPVDWHYIVGCYTTSSGSSGSDIPQKKTACTHILEAINRAREKTYQEAMDYIKELSREVTHHDKT